MPYGRISGARMKVVQINAVYQYGSTGRIVAELEEQMRKQGIESYVVYGRSMSSEAFGSHVYKMENKRGYYTHKFVTHLTGYQGYASREHTKQAVDFIDKIDPDIIHLHNLHGHYLNLEVLFEYLRIANKMVVWTFHDCWPFTGHCAHFHSVSCNRWQSGCGNCPQKLAYPRSLFFDRSAVQWRAKRHLFLSLPKLHIVTVSRWLQTLVENSFFQGCSVQTIYNGIDTNLFAPQQNLDAFKDELGLLGKKIILGAATTWTERKGLGDFLYLANKLPDDAVILLAGMMKKNVRIPHNVISLGPVNKIETLSMLYSVADVFVNPSRQETFGWTTAEARACGTPAIVYNTSACPEVVGNDYRCGSIVPSFDKDALLEAIKFRLSHDKQSEVTREMVVKRFDKEKQLEKYIHLYGNCFDR